MSLAAVQELCRGGVGELALGRHTPGTLGPALSLEFVLHIVLEEREPHSISWQWVMGRLNLLNTILRRVQ